MMRDLRHFIKQKIYVVEDRLPGKLCSHLNRNNYLSFRFFSIWNTGTVMTVKAILNAVIEYETPRYVKVHNPLVGLVLR